MANVCRLSGVKIPNSEKKVVEALELLPENYRVIAGYMLLYLHSEEKNGRKEKRIKDGEIDFLVISPDSGLLIIEVKGGGIRRGDNGLISINRYGEENYISNPYEQSKNYKDLIIKNLEEKEIKINKDYYIGHAVWFSDIKFDESLSAVGENYDKITLDSRDLNNPTKKINEILEWYKTGINTTSFINPLSLYRIFNPNGIIEPNMANRIDAEEAEIIEATGEQNEVLVSTEENNRVLVKGCAGSGKTLLAKELAKRWASQGKKVLLCCFNNLIKDSLSSELQHQNLDIYNFHHLCRKIITNAKERAPEGEDKLNERAFDLAESYPKYDAVIVDEGQDFKSEWWLTIQRLINENGKFYIFADDNQNIYQGAKYPDNMTILRLTKNCRNTKKVFEVSKKFYNGVTINALKNSDGRVVPIHLENENQLKDKLEEIVKSLIENKINIRQIIILSGKGKENSKLKDIKRLANKPLVYFKEGNGIEWSTIYSFKGLEKDIVILVEIDEIQNRNEIMYVGVTRAKHDLYVLAKKNPFD